MKEAATISSTLAGFVADLGYADLPAEVATNAKHRILDTVGVCLASIDLEYAKAMLDFTLEQGGPEEAAVYGTKRRMPASWAALYNGSLAHGNDYDDTHSKSIVHAGGAIVPTALAIAEKAGRTGKEALCAVVAAYDVVARIGMAASQGFHKQGFHPTGVCGVFSATATAGKLLGLPREHPYMDCALRLRREHALTPEQIESIELRVPTAGVAILCEPAEDKRRPKNSYAARFSLPYAVGVILVSGKAGIEEFSEARIKDPAILALCDRTRYVVDDTMPFPRSFPGWVIIQLKNGKKLEARMDASRGSREVPMSEQEVFEKFEANASRALPQSQVRQLWERGLKLETVDDMKTFTALLSN